MSVNDLDFSVKCCYLLFEINASQKTELSCSTSVEQKFGICSTEKGSNRITKETMATTNIELIKHQEEINQLLEGRE